MADNFEKIIEKILDDAGETADRILTEASLHSAATVTEAEKTAQARYEQTVAQAKEEAERVKGRIFSGYETAKRGRILEAKQEIIAGCYSEAVQRLTALPTPQKEALYTAWIRRYGEDRPYAVCLNAADAQALGPALRSACAAGTFPGSPAISEDAEPISGGVILRFGDMVKDISFETQVAQIRETTCTAVADILFGKGD